MRLVAWNCHDGFARKANALVSLHPDIAILSEVKARHLGSIKPECSTLFAGPLEAKGIAVIGLNGWQIEPAGPVFAHWFLPVIASRGTLRIKILAVWVIPANGYVEPTLSEIDRLSAFLSEGHVVVAGDFNQNVTFDKGRNARRRFSSVLEKMSQLGLSSVWHETMNEEHGRETSSTLYFLYDEAKGYHIDYVFVSKSLLNAVTDVSLGCYADWVGSKVSDHVPLSVSIDLPLV